jgi:hypothetical protein
MNWVPAFVFLLLLSLSHFAVKAQVPDMDFGAVSPETFAPTVYPLDSSANAVYLFDHGEAKFDPDYYSHYSIVYERHARIRILNKNALGLATMNISAVHYKDYNAVIDDVQGATYNLQDGKVVVTKLDKNSIFKDKNGHFDIEKLAFPDVHEGSIIEYSYRMVYPGFGYIPEWQFQRNYPVLWSQYDVSIPVLFDYFVRNQGYKPFAIDTTLLSETSFAFSTPGYIGGRWSGNVLHRTWAVQDMPPLEKAEPYTTTLRNHVQEVQFQLSAVRYGGYTKTYRSIWTELTAELLKNDNFGSPLTDKNHFLDDELKKLAEAGHAPKSEGRKPDTRPRQGGANGPAGERPGENSREAAQRIFAYVRDQFTFTGQQGVFMSQPLKKTWEDRKGGVADLNLLLTAMYRRAGFEACPVILSTRAHGYAVEAFPLLNDYDYVVTRVRADGQYYLLDASRPTSGFGQLPELCYNGVAHTIEKEPESIPLPADSARENRTTLVYLSNDDDGSLSGTYVRKLGVFESMDMRAYLHRAKPEDFFENLRKSMAEYKQMGEHGFDSVGVPEEPLSWHYSMTYRFKQKTLYFYPIMHERMNASPLPNPERHYPVEMPYRIDNNYVMHMDIPKGYRVDQLPKSVIYRLEDSSGYFQYQLSTDGHSIEFLMRMQLKRAIYSVAEYQGLHDFFALLVQKEKEPIIFKKTD